MKKFLCLLLVMIAGLACAQFAAADAAQLQLPSGGIATAVKCRIYLEDYVRMSDGSSLPDDITYSLSSTKCATVNPYSGVVLAKKAGSATLKVTSASMNLEASCTLSVAANTFADTRPVDALKALYMPGAPEHGVLCFPQKMTVKNGQLAVDVYFYNQYGYDVTKIYALNMFLIDGESGQIVSTYRKATALKKKLADGKSLKLSFKFPKCGIEGKLDLTKLDDKGLPKQIAIGGLFQFDHNAPTPDPWGYESGPQGDEALNQKARAGAIMGKQIG